MSIKNKKPIVVAVSGGFDPIHPGHIRMFKEARKLGDKLVVILNNDNWLLQKKEVIFMNETERKEVIEALKPVDEVFIAMHKKDSVDMSVCVELEMLKPDIFANGGDRNLGNIPEAGICEKIGCKMVFNVGHGGKVESSSWLLKRYLENVSGNATEKYEK